MTHPHATRRGACSILCAHHVNSPNSTISEHIGQEGRCEYCWQEYKRGFDEGWENGAKAEVIEARHATARRCAEIAEKHNPKLERQAKGINLSRYTENEQAIVQDEERGE